VARSAACRSPRACPCTPSRDLFSAATARASAYTSSGEGPGAGAGGGGSLGAEERRWRGELDKKEERG